MANKPLQTGFSRVFIIPGRAEPGHKPVYYSTVKMSGITQSFGDITKIEIPDPNEYGKFIEADRIRGAIERATFSLVGRFAAAVKSALLEFARAGCAVDVQLHIGECTDPSAFNTFTKAIIAEDSVLTSHTTDDLGALESGEGAVVNETAEISSKDYYEAIPMSYTAKADDIVTLHLNDVAVIDTASCGTCASESNGCKKVFAVSDLAGGSPGTPPDIVYTLDGGNTWKAHDIDTLTALQSAVGVAGVGDYVVVISELAGSESYALLTDFINGIDPVFTELTTGFVNFSGPMAIWSVGRKAFIVGESGYIYFMEDPTAGVTVLDAGVAATVTLQAVHALDEFYAVAVGDHGVVVWTRDGVNWEATVTNPVGGGVTLTSVWIVDAGAWWVTTSSGLVYYTQNQGASWTQKAMPGTAPSKMNAISFSTHSVGFAAGIVSSRARIYRTFDGGYSWVVVPSLSGTIPAADEFAAIATCEYDPNFVVAVGIHDNATDGKIVVGKLV
jgi:photosystem II stability/assembly factor-like uncharacterized protein